MTNMPSFETCRRLAEAGWKPDRSVWGERAWRASTTEARPYLCQWTAGALPDEGTVRFYDAPTLAEMLDEIRRHGWFVGLAGLMNGQYQAGIYSGVELISLYHHPDPAEAVAVALAVALAEAMEAAENGRA